MYAPICGAQMLTEQAKCNKNVSDYPFYQLIETLNSIKYTQGERSSVSEGPPKPSTLYTIHAYAMCIIQTHTHVA